MPDKITSVTRSQNMRQIKSTGMKPELAVRKLIYSAGYRYRLHRYDLPGRPDIVFPGKKKIVFVHGCFWHQHNDAACKLTHRPKSNSKCWLPKLDRNQQRDKEHLKNLHELGWKVIVVWECQILRQPSVVLNRLCKFLG